MLQEMRRKIAVCTGTRADYGLLSTIMTLLKNDSEFELQIVASCMHLSTQHGHTIDLIEKDGFKINAKVDMLLSGNDNISIAKSTAIGSLAFVDVFTNLNPDLIIILGDRFEALAAAQSAMLLKIPIAHIHGGELTEGAIDDSIRHTITKMASLHFTSTLEYKNRVIQMGEQPKNVFNIGAVGLDYIFSHNLLFLSDLERGLKIKFSIKPIFLITYHPETHLKHQEKAIDELLAALSQYKGTFIFTGCNADAEANIIDAKIKDFILHRKKNMGDTLRAQSLGSLNYLSLLKYTDVVIGNSSSAIIEAPIFKKPSINIGGRQFLRMSGKSVLHVKAEKDDICQAIDKSLSKEFIYTLKDLESIYGNGGSSLKLLEILRNTDFKGLSKKKFYDYKRHIEI